MTGCGNAHHFGSCLGDGNCASQLQHSSNVIDFLLCLEVCLTFHLLERVYRRAVHVGRTSKARRVDPVQQKMQAPGGSEDSAQSCIRCNQHSMLLSTTQEAANYPSRRA